MYVQAKHEVQFPTCQLCIITYNIVINLTVICVLRLMYAILSFIKVKVTKMCVINANQQFDKSTMELLA